MSADGRQPGATRVALIGLGGAAQTLHVPACLALPEVEVVAACDPRPERRQWLQRQHGVRALYASATELVEREKAEVVIVATPPQTHRDLCLLALDHGAHVLCEKPFAASVAEVDEILEAAARAHRAVTVNNEYGHLPIYRIPREHLARGEFGAPYLIQCWQQMLHLPSREGNWRAALARYVLFEFGTHPLDLVCSFFDALPEAVSAHTATCAGTSITDAVIQVTLYFPGGRLATLLCNRVSHAPTRYLEMRVDCERASLRISFGGVARAAVDWSPARRRPRLRVSLARGGEARVETGGRSRVLVREPRDGRPAATAATLRELLHAVARGDLSNAQAHRAREILRIVFAAYEAAELGETVWLRRSPP